MTVRLQELSNNYHLSVGHIFSSSQVPRTPSYLPNTKAWCQVPVIIVWGVWFSYFWPSFLVYVTFLIHEGNCICGNEICIVQRETTVVGDLRRPELSSGIWSQDKKKDICKRSFPCYFFSISPTINIQYEKCWIGWKKIIIMKILTRFPQKVNYNVSKVILCVFFHKSF